MLNDEYFIHFPQLETERLILKKFTIADAEALHAIRTDKQVMLYMDSDKHADVQATADFITKNLEAYAKKEGFFWAITLKNNKEFIGDFAFWRIDRKNYRGEIGYTLKPSAWGKGYINEAMKAIFSFAFQDFKLHSIEANVNKHNEKSKKALLRLGFQKEAHFRENYYYNGVFLDSEIYCILEKDLLI